MSTTGPAVCFTCERAGANAHVVRFIRPDLRPQLDPVVDDNNGLFRDLTAALHELAAGETVIVNCGLIERFPTSLFQLLMKVRQFAQERGARVTLCCVRPEVLPAVDLMGGAKLFGISTFEEAAIHDARTR